MGVVYHALDPAIGRPVAIKTIQLGFDSLERGWLRDRLMREAQAAGILSHPGIVAIYDVGEEGDLAYIAMEFVNGVSLDRLLMGEPPAPGVPPTGQEAVPPCRNQTGDRLSGQGGPTP